MRDDEGKAPPSSIPSWPAVPHTYDPTYAPNRQVGHTATASGDPSPPNPGGTEEPT